jgi:hypothetical protein
LFIISCLIGPISLAKRYLKAFRIREKAAKYYKQLPLYSHACNGDDIRYSNKMASFSKALPHNKHGEVDCHAYKKYMEALKTGNDDDFEKIPLGGTSKFVNPQAAYSYELVGPDSHQLVIPPPPSFHSAEAASEMVELYWQALTRDVPFSEYATDPLTIAAAKELSSLTEFRGPKFNGIVTPNLLFRANLPGAIEGPYISQFLWMDIPYVAATIKQEYRSTQSGDNHLTSYQDWMDAQNGTLVPQDVNYSTPRYLLDGRALAEYVHHDYSVEDGLTPCLILLSYGRQALAPSNPYLHSDTQVGFADFGAPHILDFVTRAARPALEAAWFQKWLVHRRLRPEEFGGRIHHKLTGAAFYPINHEVLNSEAVFRVYNKYGTYFLPQAYPEGCPPHPSYPSGHATFIGAMVTMLKAFFNEEFVIPNPVIPSKDGMSLIPYKDAPLTVGGELNKLAYNITLGRDTAGVHYRSDGVNGLKLGEMVAIGILRDYRETYHKEFKGFSLTTFDGVKITI